MEENFVATLFKSVMINVDTYLFVPISVIEGKCSNDVGVFVDNLENSYYEIKDAILNINTNTHFYGFAEEINKIMKQFNTDDKIEAIKKYYEIIGENIYVGITKNENSELEIISLSVDDLKDLASGNLDNTYEDEMEDKKVRLFLNEEGLTKLLNMETLEEIKASLNEMLNVSKEITAITKTLEKEYEKTENTSFVEPIVPNHNLDVQEMYNYITSKVINQDEAVKQILITFLMNNITVNSGFLNDLQLTRTLITGNTGCGKTLILESIIEYLERFTKFNIPMVKVPTSQLTSAGYVGMNLEDILEELVSKVTITNSLNEKIRYAEKNGVIFLDEIDKKGSKDNGDVAGRSVLNALLQFIDGANYRIFDGQKHMMNPNITPSYFNTKYLNIFASGAFTHVKEDLNKKSIGFSDETKELITKLKPEDYIKKGDMPIEFMGRFHQTIQLNPLKLNDLKDILNKSSVSPILIESQKLDIRGVNLRWDESFVEEVAKKAYNLNMGARSLKTIIEGALSEIKWMSLLHYQERTVLVSRETVENPKQYRII